MPEKGVALVIGAGPGLGGAVARRFAAEGYTVCATRRKKDSLDDLVNDIEMAGGKIHSFGVDARKEESVIELFQHIENKIGPLNAVIFNIGANIRFNIVETTTRKYYKVWEMAAFAGFLAGREAAKYMKERGQGTIIFTGATASVRGKEGFSAFAGAKHALRALAESMARELGPQGIHVAHIIVDGMIDTPWIKRNFSEVIAKMPEDAILDPIDIAENYLFIHNQPRSAWTFEMDLRPWCEKW
ncbi:MAG: SDR family oxidoreductase [Chloroflexota bacterium]